MKILLCSNDEESCQFPWSEDSIDDKGGREEAADTAVHTSYAESSVCVALLSLRDGWMTFCRP